MPIDDILKGINEEKRIEKPAEERTTIVQPPNLFPTQKCSQLLDRTERLKRILPPGSSVRVSTSDLMTTLDYFHPYERFYIKMKNELDHMVSEFERWDKYFEGVIQATTQDSRPASQVRTPNVLYEDLLETIREGLEGINKEANELPNETTKKEMKEFERKAKMINDALVELYNTNNLLDVVLLERALASGLKSISSYIPVTRGSSERYIQQLQILNDFAQGKESIGYSYQYDTIEDLRDLSPTKGFFGTLLNPFRR